MQHFDEFESDGICYLYCLQQYIWEVFEGSNCTGIKPTLNFARIVSFRFMNSINFQLSYLWCISLGWLCMWLMNRILHGNLLFGTIPKEIGMLKNLEVLDLGSNQLTGKIPPEIGNLTSIVKMLVDNEW